MFCVVFAEISASAKVVHRSDATSWMDYRALSKYDLNAGPGFLKMKKDGFTNGRIRLVSDLKGAHGQSVVVTLSQSGYCESLEVGSQTKEDATYTECEFQRYVIERHFKFCLFACVPSEEFQIFWNKFNAIEDDPGKIHMITVSQSRW